MAEEKTDFDVAIIGGGPAGASMGAYLAKAGVQCVVLERELFPRPHVGESLVPSSTRVFRDLDFLPKMEEAGFPHKFGAVWTSASSRSGAYATHGWEGLEEDLVGGSKPNEADAEATVKPASEATIRFQERAQEGVDRPYTYHVDRGKFDLLLLQHAEQLGATVYEGLRVRGVDFNHGGNPHVQFTMGRKEMSVSAKIVVDASGRHTLLGNQLKLKVKDPHFDQYAVHSWFDGYDRSLTTKSKLLGDYIFIHFLPISNSWVWQIPITDKLTSVGVVTQKKNFQRYKGERAKLFWEAVGSRPELSEGLKKAVQTRAFAEEGDYSYAMKQIVGDRFVLLGDAARFVDPIFSTGVSIALNSSRFAHTDIVAALAQGNHTRSAFANYEETIRRGTRNWYDFISVYYRLNILFTYFVNDPEYRLDVLKLLQGDVYDDEQPAVLERMKATVKKIEKNPKHIWHDLLSDLTAEAQAPAA